MAEVALEQVTKRYPNGATAVRDLNLTVADGELIVLVGPSGCGKTTTLRLIAGLEPPTSGAIRIGGRDVRTLSPSQRDVAMVFQRPALYPQLSVRDNLAVGYRMRHERSRLARLTWRWLRPARYAEVLKQDQVLSERVAQAADLLELENLLERRPRELSGGEQQRVALGRALVRQPGVFLLDEPLSNLDTHLRAEMRRQLHLLHRRLPATMIYVTHDQVEAMSLGDRVVVLRQGVAQQVDRPLALYEKPCNRFVAGFIGWPPMNLVDGELVLHEGQLCFAAHGQLLPLPAIRAGEWEAYRGRPVTLGVRPENVRVGDGLADCKLRMEVNLIEPLGGASVITLQRGGWRLTARQEECRGIAERQTVEVVVDMRRSHLFDRATGLALGKSCPEG